MQLEVYERVFKHLFTTIIGLGVGGAIGAYDIIQKGEITQENMVLGVLAGVVGALFKNPKFVLNLSKPKQSDEGELQNEEN